MTNVGSEIDRDADNYVQGEVAKFFLRQHPDVKTCPQALAKADELEEWLADVGLEVAPKSATEAATDLAERTGMPHGVAQARVMRKRRGRR